MTKLCVTEVCVTKLCVTEVCVTKLYVTELCVNVCEDAETDAEVPGRGGGGAQI